MGDLDTEEAQMRKGPERMMDVEGCSGITEERMVGGGGREARGEGGEGGE